MAFLKKNKWVRKLLTRPIWYWERNRPHPIRERIWKAAPRPVPENQGTVLMISSGVATLQDGAWSAKSFLENLPPMGLLFASQNFSDERQRQLSGLFPGAQMIADDYFMEEIGRLAPNVRKLAEYHPMGRKLAAVLVASSRWNVVFADADVLAFNPLPELFAAAEMKADRGLYIQDISVMIETHTKKRADAKGLGYPPRFSCGLMYIPKGSFDIPLANDLLDVDEKITEWFPDTMVLAVLAEKAGFQPLSDEYYFQTSHRQFYFYPDVDYGKIRARHFTTPVRHLMYLKGMPFLWKKWRQ